MLNEDQYSWTQLKSHLCLWRLSPHYNRDNFKIIWVWFPSLPHHTSLLNLYYLAAFCKQSWNPWGQDLVNLEPNELNLFYNMPSHTFHHNLKHLLNQKVPMHSFLSLCLPKLCCNSKLLCILEPHCKILLQNMHLKLVHIAHLY